MVLFRESEMISILMIVVFLVKKLLLRQEFSGNLFKSELLPIYSLLI